MFSVHSRDLPAAPAVLDGELLFSVVRDGARAFATPGFDAWRFAYASAVVLGLAPRSMLGSRDAECVVDALERCALGPFARSV